jgi:hypothetical protein
MTGLPTLVGWKHHENQWRGWGAPIPVHLQRRFFDDFADRLPPIDWPEPLPRQAELDLFKISLDGTGAVTERIAARWPRENARVLAKRLVDARQNVFSASSFLERLHERMGEIYRAPALDPRTRELMRLYRIKYVFAGSLEKEAFGHGLDKFGTLPQVFFRDGVAIYEVTN